MRSQMYNFSIISYLREWFCCKKSHQLFARRGLIRKSCPNAQRVASSDTELSPPGGSRDVSWLGCENALLELCRWRLSSWQCGLIHVHTEAVLLVHRRHRVPYLPESPSPTRAHARAQHAVFWHRVHSGLSSAFYFSTPPLTAPNGLSGSTPAPSCHSTVPVSGCVCV